MLLTNVINNFAFIWCFQKIFKEFMTETELHYLLALQKVDGVGDIIAKKLLNHFGSAEAIFSAKNSQLATVDGIGRTLLNNLKDKTIFAQAEEELKYIQNNSITVSYFKEENYSEKLKHCIENVVLSHKNDIFNVFCN